MGFPTMSLRPITTAWAPAMGMPDRTSSSMTPDGVHGARRARFCESRPALTGREPVHVLGRIDQVEHRLRRLIPQRGR
jgi:hypothetical protein